MYWVTHVTDGVTVDIIWIQGTMMPWNDTKLGHLKKEKNVHLIYVLYILYLIYIYIYIVYILYLHEIPYI